MSNGWNLIPIVAAFIGALYGMVTGDILLAVTFLNTGLIITCLSAILSGQAIVVVFPEGEEDESK